MSIVLRRKGEQFKISAGLGTPLLPSRSRGLHKIAFVMKTSHLCHCIARKSSSNRSPVRSPNKGTPVFSAPSRPGASATNITLASHGPFKSPSTRRDRDMRGHKTHACALSTRCLLKDLNSAWDCQHPFTPARKLRFSIHISESLQSFRVSPEIGQGCTFCE